MSASIELIQLLCTEAGMIMEDAIVEAIAVVREEEQERHARLAKLRQAATDISTLVSAAEVFHRRARG